MDWTQTMFLDWPCWESGKFRIIRVADEEIYELYFDAGISTQIWKLGSLKEAREKAQEMLKEAREKMDENTP